MKIDRTKIKKILFITLNNLGDIILTTPVLDVLCRNFPNAEIDVITGPPGKDVFQDHPSVRNVMVRQKRMSIKGRVRELMALREIKYDLTVDMKNSLIPWMVGAKYCPKVAFPAKRALHKREEHLSKLSGMGLDVPQDPHFFIPVSEAEKNFIDRQIGDAKSNGICVINPGSKSHLKRWDVKKFSKLSDNIVNELGFKVFVIGNSDDADIVRMFEDNVEQKVINLCGRTSLGALSELIKRSDIIVTNDSAPLHVASAAGTKSVAIFGPSDEKKYGPISSESIVVTPDKSCRPCSNALCSVGPEEGCISEISVEEVFEAVKKVVGL